MNIINEYYSSLNIYFSLLVYRDDIPYELVGELKQADFPVVIVHDLNELDFLEINYRMFVIKQEMLSAVLYAKHNAIDQYSVLFCMGDDTFDYVVDVLKDKTPSCVENILVTKI